MQELTDAERSKMTDQCRYWENRLIDLSRRNRLINLRSGPAAASILSILHERNASVFSALYSRKHSFVFQATGDNAGLSGQNFTEKTLSVPLSEERLKKVLTNIYRQNRSSMEEQGYNTLYLAVGILRWQEQSWYPGTEKTPAELEKPEELVKPAEPENPRPLPI